MTAALHPAVAELLDSRRLGSLEASRHRFTVSREEALLSLREQARLRGDQRWDWSLQLVRAANALGDAPSVTIDVQTTADELQITTLDVVVPGASFTGLDLTDVLAGALEPDLGAPLEVDDRELHVGRFRMLIGRALNAALAHEPVAVELATPVGGRRFERREQLVAGRDPFVQRKVAACEGESRFVVRIVDLRPGLSSRLGRWLRGRGEVTDELAKLWTANRVADHELDNVGEDGSLLLGPGLARAPVRFGSHARYGPLAEVEGAPELLKTSLYLVRDGLLLVDLGPALRAHQLDPAALAGWVDCPKLRLTADELGVVHDGNLDLLVAWLQDFSARADETGAVAWPDSLGEGPRAANGHAITVEQLAEDARRGRELVYVWRHQAAAVPAHARARVAALWPVEEVLLREQFPDLRLVPLRALGGQSDFDPADLTALAQGTHEPLALVRDGPIPRREGSNEILRLSIDAYVHRAPTATGGFIVILAYERRIAQVQDQGKVFAGVTLVCRVRPSDGDPELDVGALRRDQATLTQVVAACRRETEKHWEALLAHVMSRANPWESPLLRAALDQLSPLTIELRYQQTDDGVRLAWRDSVLLDTVVGRTRDGESRTLRDGLRQLRERGYVLVGHPLKRYEQIRSDDPRLRPWLVDEVARAVLHRLIGHATVLDMPVVAEAHPLVADDPVEDQRHLLRGHETIETWLERSSGDPLARLRLIGHLLVARGLEQDSVGLETVPLLSRYDPRALSPTRLVSLASVLAERPQPGLIPAGAVHRGLPRPMLEVEPGVAALLAEVEALEPGGGGAVAPTVTTDRTPNERSSTTPIRRRARGIPPLLAKSVVHTLAIGRLQVAGDASSDGIGLWAEGLRIGELELGEPLGRVSGRLLLTPVGRRIGAAKIRELATEEARALLADALRQRTLLPPDGPQRRRLDHFVEYVRTVVKGDDRFDLADAFGLGKPEDRGERVAALRKMSLGAAPLRPLGDRREALLVDIVRQSLAMRVYFDTAILSWKPAKLAGRRRDGGFVLEFGLRNAWIQRALDEDRKLAPAEHRRAALLAGVVVVGSFFWQSWARDEVDLGPEHLVVALWRLLKLAER